MTRQSVTFEVPIRTQGTQNRRDHWAPKMERTAKERADVGLIGQALKSRGIIGLRSPLVVTLTRIWAPHVIPGKGQAELDAHENLPAALKAVADEVTRLLGFASDRDPDIAFTYGQERGDKPAVRVLIQGPCRARTVIYDVEPGSAPETGEPRIAWKDGPPLPFESIPTPDEHARAELLNNRGIPGSNDDEIAATMLPGRET